MQHCFIPNLIQLESRYSDLLLREVYTEPKHYDRVKILGLLKEIKHAYPQRVPIIIKAAFERVVENSSMDKGTWLIEQFLAHGAEVASPKLLHKAVQDLDPDSDEPPHMPQVVAVVQRLLLAGANPSETLTGRQVFENPLPVQAIVRAMANIHDLAEND